MKKLLLLGLGIVMVAGCGKLHGMIGGSGPQVVGSGEMATENRTVGAFKNVSLNGAFDADITIGKQSEIKIEAEDNLLKLIKTEIKGDTLHISTEGNISTSKGMKVTFSASQLEETTINGSGDVTVKGLKGDKVAFRINGSGSVEADGSAKRVAATVNGSGDVNLGKVAASEADVSIHGSGDVLVHATEKLFGSIAGSGSIRYRGNPKSVEKSIAGSGELVPEN